MFWLVGLTVLILSACSSNASADKTTIDQATSVNTKEVENSIPTQVLGSTKDQVKELYKSFKVNTAYTTNVDPEAMKFEADNYFIVVEFDSNGLAEGVSYLSFDGELNGKGSYVDQNRDQIMNFVTGGGEYPVTDNVNPDVGFEYPAEIYIGTMHR